MGHGIYNFSFGWKFNFFFTVLLLRLVFAIACLLPHLHPTPGCRLYRCCFFFFWSLALGVHCLVVFPFVKDGHSVNMKPLQLGWLWLEWQGNEDQWRIDRQGPNTHRKLLSLMLMWIDLNQWKCASFFF